MPRDSKLSDVTHISGEKGQGFVSDLHVSTNPSDYSAATLHPIGVTPDDAFHSQHPAAHLSQRAQTLRQEFNLATTNS